MHVIAAKTVAFKEALTEFKTYAHHIVENTRALAAGLRGKRSADCFWRDSGQPFDACRSDDQDVTSKTAEHRA
jgi:hypothetical protein